MTRWAVDHGAQRVRVGHRDARPSLGVADRLARVGFGAEPFELRMPRVPASAAFEHRLREQRLAPARRDFLAIEIARMQRPDPHPSRVRPAQRLPLAFFWPFSGEGGD
jgi:hypothetical protein